MIANDKSQDTVEELIDAGSALAGSAASAAMAFLGKDPAIVIAGSVAGSALAMGLRLLAQELKQRFLGPREEERIGATLAFAAERIQAKLLAGDKIREDGFFSSLNEGARPSSDEILEAVLLVAQREYQEKKLKFYGNLVANIAFDPSVDPEQAHLLIKLGENLSYRQLCLLALFASTYTDSLRSENYVKKETLATSTVALLVEIFDLYSKGLLNASGEALLTLPHITPSKMRTQGTGVQLFTLMELSKVPREDLLEVVNALKG